MDLQTETIDALEPGSPCPDAGCTGHLDIAPTVNCSCHISAPCSSCENAGLLCDVCGWDSTPAPADREDEYEQRSIQEREAWAAKAGARSHLTTTTYTCSPVNSTPFTRCCEIAAIDKDRCPHCSARITHHDDGLAARRRQVGHGNCLMCGKPHGDIAIAGNCHC